MISESLYFSFDGRKSTDYPIANVNTSTGLYEEPIVANKSIIETKINGNNTPYFQGVNRDPKQFTLRFVFTEPWNDELIEEIIHWLDVDYYKPLFFSENIDHVFYVQFINGITSIHNGLKEGYLELTARCNSAHHFSHMKSTPLYEVNGDENINIVNKGRNAIKPTIYITKVGEGDVSIFNLTNRNEEFKLQNLEDGERLIVNCLSEEIETNIKDIYRYDDFNDNYLSLVYGKNRLKIVGDAKVLFEYRYIY